MKEKLHAESTVSIKLIFSPKVGGGGRWRWSLVEEGYF